jgi:hypothetical protein
LFHPIVYRQKYMTFSWLMVKVRGSI